MTIAKTAAILLALCNVGPCVGTPALAVSVRERKTVARFGGECEPPAFFATQKLRALVRSERRQRDELCNGSWCDGAHAIDLDGDGRNELLVPLGCGATGNCTWGVYSDRPARFHGAFTAWFIFVERRGSGWASIRTYTREGGDRGTIEKLSFQGGRYRVVSEYTEKRDGQQASPFLSKMGLPDCG